MTYTVKGARLAKAKLTSLCETYPESALAVLRGLRRIQEKGPLYQECGICGNLAGAVSEFGWAYIEETVDSDDFLHQIWPTWRHWTGCEDYPVPASLKNKCPESARCEYVGFKRWDAGSEYNKLRRELLAHCITTLAEAIDNAKD